ncbi:MAG: VCBS repeat-containing protein [Propionivibrio sp.]|uniref:VCBS repeat-containing protein n=1 Tax=Candidatus Propionivibrio dominans TaxID=2954373 RepID=A0A9D7F955_9RHOO|nr:VCBS repeat-containing protein [Candidatus Propionivibrio dominans]MBL0167850.1 VCBS repeat-containing protein [Propionivibrio sp.]
MKIASSALQMESSHNKLQQHEIRESLRTWVGDRRPDFEGNQRARLPAFDRVQLSDAGKTAQSSEASTIQDSIDAAEKDPMLRLIIAMVAMLTGREVKVFDARELQVDSPAPAIQDPHSSSQSNQAQAAQQAAGYGVEYDRHESTTESEQTRFAAAGVVRTEDGKEINFTVSLSMARSYHEQSDVSIRLGDARKKQDPLVLNFSGTAAQLTSQRFRFDLNSDGKSEDINFVTGGSGFLALDRNGDGRINNGSELFGTTSGNGFAELAVLDADHNGWIDENDAAYEQLRVWTRDVSGKEQLSTLKQANVGALSLARAETPFDLKDSNNDLQGQIRSSGLFLLEDGKAGTLQQIDLTV